MHDIADLEGRGLVGVFLASSEFRDAADVQSRALGLAVPYVLVPHPIQDRTDEEVVAMADDAYTAVLAAVTGAAASPGRAVDLPGGAGKDAGD